MASTFLFFVEYIQKQFSSFVKIADISTKQHFTIGNLYKTRGLDLQLFKKSIIIVIECFIYGNTVQRLCDRCVVKFFVRWNKKRSEYLMYSRAFLWNMTGNLQADGVQSRQTLFVRYCLMHINYEILYIVLLFAVNSKKNLHDFFDSCEFL